MPAAKPCYTLFALDTQRVVNEEIHREFANLDPKPLDAVNLAALRAYEASTERAKKGLYVLHYDGNPVYAGKTDELLSKRLAEHLEKLSSRPNLHPDKVGFRCVYFDKNWSALAQEGPLIAKLGLPWNQSGIGGHDFGRGRDWTELKADHFDRLFPINTAIAITGIPEGQQTVKVVLNHLFKHLPYLLRVQKTKSKQLLPIYSTTHITVTAAETVESLLGKIVDQLGAHWQVTFLCGYAIVYEENDTYPAFSYLKYKRGGTAWVVHP